MLQRAHDRADHVGGDVRVEHGRIQLGMSEQHLDDADIDFLLQQMGSEAVPQGMRRDPLIDPRHLGGSMTGAIELARGHRLRRIAAREQPTSRPRQQERVAIQGNLNADNQELLDHLRHLA